MPLFTYIAKNASGQIVHGSITSLSAQAARESLKEMQLDAEELYEAPLAHAQPPPLIADSPPAWQVTPEPAAVASAPAMRAPAEPPKPAPPVKKTYYPIMDTLRLYAGWLFAWYFLIFALGAYAFTRALPFEIPLAGSLFRSPIIISFAFGTFLFLLVTDVHRRLGKGIGLGLILTAGWFGVFLLFRMNT